MRQHAGVEPKFGYAGRVTDTHCHVTFPRYDADRAEVLSRAAATGVKIIVNPGTDVVQSRAAVALAEARTSELPVVFAAVGVHPHDVGQLTEEGFQELAALARRPRVVAVGEVGLEQSTRSPALSVQRQWLTKFCELAQEVENPLLFHVRDAHAEFRMFLEAEGSGVRGVVHCFSGTREDATWYIQHGLFLGITGIVTFPNAGALHEVVRAVPLGHLLLETDALFLAPQSHRGQRNEPAYVREVAQEIACLKGTTVKVVEEATRRNARQLFSLPVS